LISAEPLGDAWHDSKLGGKLRNVIDKSGDISLDDRMNDLKHAQAFIGVGSGLSWLAWTMNTPVVMISGFSDVWTEFESGCERIINTAVCNSCFNRERLDPGDWVWCPDHKGTDRHFECTKTIPTEVVIERFNKIVGNG
jgi:autotransporter strand-loop-strand O-heptosyltransferase